MVEEREDPAGPAWESRGALGAGSAFLGTVRESSLRPTAFFRSLKPAGNAMDAALYGIGILLITSVVQVAWAFVITPIPFLILAKQGIAPEVPAALLAFTSWVRIFVAPIAAVVTFFLLAGLFHGGLIILGAARRPFETTFRAVCYSTGPLLLSLVPFCGEPVGKIWTLVLVIIGLKECHETTAGKAIVAVLLPVIVLGGCCGTILWAALLGRLFSG
jgi:hypothetical protein